MPFPYNPLTKKVSFRLTEAELVELRNHADLKAESVGETTRQAIAAYLANDTKPHTLSEMANVEGVLKDYLVLYSKLYDRSFQHERIKRAIEFVESQRTQS